MNKNSISTILLLIELLQELLAKREKQIQGVARKCSKRTQHQQDAHRKRERTKELPRELLQANRGRKEQAYYNVRPYLSIFFFYSLDQV